MANQITIDIVAETRKLTSGINDANSQIDGMSTKLKGAAAAAGAAASAFVLKQGVTFLKQGIDEAKEAAETMRAATTTFGEGSAALEKITADADKFGKAIAVDNDVIIQLSTQLGSRLPADAKALSAELVNLAFDVEAFTGGAISADAVTGKLAKAFADGQLKATELTKIFPDLSAATYEQAEALSKAGKNQEALSLLIDAGQAKYGDAAEKNVTSSQKFETALADLKETIGTKILPILETAVDFLTKMIEAFSNLSTPVQNIIIGLVAIVAIGGPVLTFLASMKIALETLGLTTKIATAFQTAFNAVMAANPIALVVLAIVALIAIIVLLVKNWDTVTEVVGKVWNAIKNFASDAWGALKGFGSKIAGFVKDIVTDFMELPKEMLGIGMDIVRGLWNGINSMVGWLKKKIADSLVGKLINQVTNLFGIFSPSKVFAEIGVNLVKGLALGLERGAGIVDSAATSLVGNTINPFTVPTLRTSSLVGSGVNITINAGLGTDPYALGRTVQQALNKYNTISK